MKASLVIPKYIRIENTRLAVLYWFTLCWAAVFLICRFAYSRHWANKVHFARDSDIDVSMWPLDVEDEALVSSWSTNAQQIICTMPSAYDYWFDDYHKYETDGCVFVCPRNAVAPDPNCSRREETFRRESQDQLLFVSRHEVVTLAPNGSKIVHAKFFADVETQGIGMSFNYNVRVPLFEWPFFFGQGSMQRVGSSRRNILAIVMDFNGRLSNVLKPEAGMQFRVPEMLRLAGKENFLDAPDKSKSVNRKKNAMLDHPTGRVSGGVLAVHLDCRDAPSIFEFSDNEDADMARELWSEQQYDAFCCLKFTIGFDQWAYSEQQRERGSGELVTITGIRVKCLKTGVFEFVDANRIFLNFTSALVLLGLTKTFVLFITVRCLGLLSRIYRRVIYEPFDIGKEVSGLTTRLIFGSVAFRKLQDLGAKGDWTGPGAGVSEGAIGNQVKMLLAPEKKHLQSLEQETFARFCWESALQRTDEDFVKSPIAAVLADLPSWCSASHRRESVTKSEILTIDKFNHASTNSEHIEFGSVVRLFDKDRRQGLLEAWFMPGALTRRIKKAEKHVQQRRQGGADLPRVGGLPSVKPSLELADLADLRQSLERRLDELERVHEEWYEKMMDMDERFRNFACERTVDRVDVAGPSHKGEQKLQAVSEDNLRPDVTDAAMEEKMQEVAARIVAQSVGRLEGRIRHLESKLRALDLGGRPTELEREPQDNFALTVPGEHHRPNWARPDLHGLQPCSAPSPQHVPLHVANKPFVPDEGFKQWVFKKLSQCVHEQTELAESCEKLSQTLGTELPRVEALEQHLGELVDLAQGLAEKIDGSHSLCKTDSRANVGVPATPDLMNTAQKLGWTGFVPTCRPGKARRTCPPATKSPAKRSGERSLRFAFDGEAETLGASSSHSYSPHPSRETTAESIDAGIGCSQPIRESTAESSETVCLSTSPHSTGESTAWSIEAGDVAVEITTDSVLSVCGELGASSVLENEELVNTVQQFGWTGFVPTCRPGKTRRTISPVPASPAKHSGSRRVRFAVDDGSRDAREEAAEDFVLSEHQTGVGVR